MPGCEGKCGFETHTFLAPSLGKECRRYGKSAPRSLWQGRVYGMVHSRAGLKPATGVGWSVDLCDRSSVALYVGAIFKPALLLAEPKRIRNCIYERDHLVCLNSAIWLLPRFVGGPNACGYRPGGSEMSSDRPLRQQERHLAGQSLFRFDIWEES